MCVCVCVCAHVRMHTWAHTGMCACMNPLPSFWFQSNNNNHYLSCKIALLSFHYVLLTQLAILATIHVVLQMLHRMNQHEDDNFTTPVTFFVNHSL